MKSFIENFASQLSEALQIADNSKVVPQQKSIRNIVATGMGGSAFAGEIVKGYVADKSKAPFIISREYEVAKYVSKNTLLLACSYSGNTEETLAAVEMAEAQGAEIVCITSGGELQKWAEARGKNILFIPKGYPPRAAAGFGTILQLQVLHAYKLIPNYRKDMEIAFKTIEGFKDHAAAEKLAKSMKDKFLYLYASGKMEAIAIRWRQQIQENSKQVCSHHIVPEMNHNELVGWKQPATLLKHAHATFLHSSYDHPRTTLRMNLNGETIQTCTPHVHHLKAKGRGYMAQMMYLLHFGDWVSYYLAEENQEDPSPVLVIDKLKNALSKVSR